MKDYSFQERLLLSSGVAANTNVRAILMNNIPGALSVEQAQLEDDKTGVDWFVYRQKIHPIRIDAKVRETDPIQEFGKDDLALETWSVIGIKPGWTRDTQKQSDYILWLFKPTARWVLIPFPMLQQVFTAHMKAWCEHYKVSRQTSEGGRWRSECVFVPRAVIWQSIYNRYGGKP